MSDSVRTRPRLSVIGDARARSRPLVGGVKSAVFIWPTDQSRASSMPFLPPLDFLRTANLQTASIGVALPDRLALFHSLNHHQKATEETRRENRYLPC